MDGEIARRRELCELAGNPDWEDVVLLADNLQPAEKDFIRAHPPGLVEALWKHFDATRDKCGCESLSHERPDCTVRLIERLLLREESA
ncbi:MAG: hypothetical protein JXB36_19300 [Gammaproteobacteria bacterium]|nr:hypothetical protein [Gammaproteobacteria bacterium]